MIKEINVREIGKMAEEGGEYQIIDVREFPEFGSERVQGARLMPLSNFEKHTGDIDQTKPVYLMCRSGGRAKQAAEKLISKGFTDVSVIEGGMTAWASANLPVIIGESKVWSLERQVRFAAGSLVVLGVLLSAIVHPYFVALSAFVGAGLVFAAVTDTCGMAMMLAKMPWNQSKGVTCDVAPAQKA
ncbi:MAG TPA: rhodanese-like domain-containing protein [Pyrinomonadaceae bacterium]|nr:rhodanese-like domain-containing protein [Pyrinomonadaceae bacterium]